MSKPRTWYIVMWKGVYVYDRVYPTLKQAKKHLALIRALWKNDPDLINVELIKVKEEK